MFEQLFSALPHVFALANFLAVVVGVIAGIQVGDLPGLSATMAISVLVPFTFGMDPLVALGMMAGIYNGAMYGGAIPAVLLRIPVRRPRWQRPSMATPWRRQGRGGTACRWPLFLPPSARWPARWR
jgi:putative tricarboxylic transport membrane protein